MSEKNIVNNIRDYLKKQGFFVLKLHGSNMQQPGIPDLLAIKDGRAYWFEVKTDKGRATKLQVHMIEQLRGFGCVVEVVRSVNDVKACLAGIPL